MSYEEFLSRIREFVGKTMEFEAVWRSNGTPFGKFQRIVWGADDFGELQEDSIIDIVSVKEVQPESPEKFDKNGICFIETRGTYCDWGKDFDD